MEYEMGVQSTDAGNDVGLNKRRKKSEIKKKAIKFTKIVSLVGLRHATDSRNSSSRRLVWVAWVVFGVGLAVYQIQERVTVYWGYPSSTNIRVLTTDKPLRFPQVTICSDNQISADKARAAGNFIAIANVENTMQRLRVYEEREYEPHLQRQTRMLLTDYINNLHNITTDWFNISKELSPNADDSILIASFNEGKNRSLIEEVRTDLGRCFAFGSNSNPLYTEKAGPVNGLNLILIAPRLQIIPNVRYLANSNSFPGFRVLIHDPNDIPRMRHAGFSLRPGKITRVTVELKNVTLLGDPYGTCNDADMAYKASHCLADCDDKDFIRRCGCRTNYMHKHKNVTYCSFGEVLNCSHALLISRNVEDAGVNISCDCPKQCHRRLYTPSVTDSPFPQVLSDEVKAAQEAKGSSSSNSEDLIQAIIYYPQMSYTEWQTVESYPALKLLCDVGNALSLLLGATLLTIYEASEFLVVFFSDYLRFRCTK